MIELGEAQIDPRNFGLRQQTGLFVAHIALQVGQVVIESKASDKPPQPSNNAAVVTQREPQTGFKLLPEETIRRLKDSGRRVYLLDDSVEKMRIAGRDFSVGWHGNEPDFERETSIRGHVAIDPKQPFLPGSENKGYPGNDKDVKVFAGKIAREFPGATAIIGKAVDYMALYFAHLEATGGELFDWPIPSVCITRTTSELPPETEWQRSQTDSWRYVRHIQVGGSADGHLDLMKGGPFHYHPNIYVGIAPLIVAA